MLVRDIYDKVATITGFPLYVNETDTPDIVRFLLECITQGLQSTIDDLYMSNNVLERTDTIVTSPNKDKYEIEGIIKNLQFIKTKKEIKQIPYNDRFNKSAILEDKPSNYGEPESYCISAGYLKLLPTPDSEYTLKVTVSTTDLVLADDDTSYSDITSINDSVLGSARFCDLVILKTAVLIFTRCQNANAAIYSTLYQDRLKTFIEHDNGTMQAQRGWIHKAGHYNPDKGLLG